MNENLGAGLTLREAKTGYWPGAVKPINASSEAAGVKPGEPVVAFCTPSQIGATNEVCLAIRDVEPVIRYLQSDEYYLSPPVVESVKVEKEGAGAHSSCTVCQHHSTPEAVSVYKFKQNNPLTLIHASLHETCVPRFIEALENVYNHSDCLLAGEL